MPILPTDSTTERGYMQILPVSVSNAVNMVNVVYLTGTSQLGSVFAWFGDIQVTTNFAEKLGRAKCQFSLPTLPPKEDICNFFRYQSAMQSTWSVLCI